MAIEAGEFNPVGEAKSAIGAPVSASYSPNVLLFEFAM
jgi:hypothetical protein